MVYPDRQWCLFDGLSHFVCSAEVGIFARFCFHGNGGGALGLSDSSIAYYFVIYSTYLPRIYERCCVSHLKSTVLSTAVAAPLYYVMPATVIGTFSYCF